MVNKLSVYIDVENFKSIMVWQDIVFLFWLKGHMFNGKVFSHVAVNM
jgi:hypothetical protein